MSFTNVGTIRPSIHEKYVKALGCRNTTFVVPKDTNTLCRLVELIVRPNTVVVDLGCGDGIPTTHAAACGARRVLGVEINPLAVRQYAHQHRACNAARGYTRCGADRHARVPG